MISKIIVFACLVATTFGFYALGPNCKVVDLEVTTQVCHIKPTQVCGTEVDGAIILQSIAPDKVCAEVKDTLCVPAVVPADGCKEVSRGEVCFPSHKVVDTSTGVIPAPYAIELICRLIPKGVCVPQVHKVPTTVCEPLELPKLYFYGK